MRLIKNKTKPKRKQIPLAIILVTIFLHLSSIGHTAIAKSIGLSIAPPSLEIIMKPNTNIIQAYTIKNQGETMQFVAKIAKIMQIDNSGSTTIETKVFDPASTPLSFSLENADLKLSEPFLLESGNSTQLVLKIESASISESEDSYLALTVEPYSPMQKPGNSGQQPVIASLILATVTPTESVPIELELTNFNPPMLHDSSRKLSFTPQLNNTSSIMIRPLGKLTITNWRGQIVHEQDLFPHLILGNTSRTMEGLIQEENKAPISTPLSWKSKFSWGPHLVNLAITTQKGTEILEETHTTWVLPLQSITYMFLLAVLGALLLKERQQNQEPGKEN